MKTIVCSRKKLWPTLTLLQDYEKQKKSYSEQQNDESELNEKTDLRDAIIEQLVDDPNDLTGSPGRKKNNYDEIVADILDSGDDDEGERGTDCVAAAPQTVNTDQALRALTTAITWAEENIASASELLTLKGLQEKMLTHSFDAKKQKTIKDCFPACNK
ncbi:hypothetical protein J6590_089647 [Homalodisca vitripennis]|nr:hypothetical protein J6590_089647 [Homalodisca vitripennis]